MNFNLDNTYTSLPQELFSAVKPTKVDAPRMVIFNERLAEELGLDSSNNSEEQLANLFSGNKLPTNSANIAQAYAGHQFGGFNRLGDGRAMLLGEHLTPEGHRFDFQFKGSGPTPYSRRGDGKSTLASSIREYVFSEAMHTLKIPSTQSLAVVGTNAPVYRERVEEGGVLTRVAQSHIRVGTFEYAMNFCSRDTQQALSTYTINRHYPELKNSSTPALSLLEKVMTKQIDLIIDWMRVGFIHGVMNTDNMSISGETIDFGPCAFMNAYNPGTVFSSIDVNKRYAFDNQPSIALWNLTRFAETLLPQIDEDMSKAIEQAKAILDQYQPEFQQKFMNMMLRKLGLTSPQVEDHRLVTSLLKWMEKYSADYTNTFVQLMYPELQLNACFQQSDVIDWIEDWKLRVKLESNSLATMQSVNPVYIPRNYHVEQAIEQASKGEMSLLADLMSHISEPYGNIDTINKYMEPADTEFEKSYKTYCGT